MLPAWVQKIGKLGLFLLTNFFTILTSNLITFLVSIILFDGVRKGGFILPTLIPIALGMPLSYIYILLLFELDDTKAKLETLAITDELTSANNRRYFIQRVDLILKTKPQQPFAVFLMDFDNFKQVNDTFGHPAGDYVLQQYAKLCQKEIRSTDTFARLGGDEFALLLPNTSKKDAEIFSRRLLNILSTTNVKYNQHTISFSVSIGLTFWTQRIKTTEHLLITMDRALYTAKNNGKNQIAVLVS